MKYSRSATSSSTIVTFIAKQNKFILEHPDTLTPSGHDIDSPF